LPRVGPDLQIDIDAVARLKPDLVLASLTVPGHERVLEGLRAAKLPFIAPEPVSLADVYCDIGAIGAQLGLAARAEELIASMRAAIAVPACASSVQPRVLVEWWPKPVIVAARDSWVNDLLAAAGAINPLASVAAKSQPLTNEQAAALAPDAIVISWCGVRVEKYRRDVVYRRPGWERVPAVVNARVYPIAEAYLGRPGPRLVEGFRALRAVVRACRAEGSHSPSES
jgi:iron complex transport system substrate-binding protein